jgi:hypothetical protein
MTTPSRASSPVVDQTYRLLCGIPALAEEIGGRLRRLGWIISTTAPLGLLIDGPWGVAPRGLEQGHPSELVVVTDNPCPEYWEDLWSYRPCGLLAGGHSVEDLAEALRRARAGECFRRTPPHDSPLTLVERHLLRHCAMGWDTHRMA